MILFPSTLVVASNLDPVGRLLTGFGHKEILNDPDIFVLPEFTIESVRQITGFLSRAPLKHSTKIVIVPDAHRLNPESQNCLLKNLEEPGEGNYFILQTIRPNSLLSTILSRCHIQNFAKKSAATGKAWEFPGNIPAGLATADSLPKTRDELSVAIDDQIVLYQQQLVKNPLPKTAKIIGVLLKAQKLLQANVDAKTTADFLMLSDLS